MVALQPYLLDGCNSFSANLPDQHTGLAGPLAESVKRFKRHIVDFAFATNRAASLDPNIHQEDTAICCASALRQASVPLLQSQ